MRRSRARYSGLVIAAVLLGLASRRFAADLPSVVANYAGDTLWASMVYLLAALIWNKATFARLAFGGLAFCFGVELSQLYSAPWINAVRATRLGGLVLGYGFLWSDLLCYSVGVGLAASIDKAASIGRKTHL